MNLENLLADDILIKQEPEEELTVADLRDRQKKDNHNMSKFINAYKHQLPNALCLLGSNLRYNKFQLFCISDEILIHHVIFHVHSHQ